MRPRIVIVDDDPTFLATVRRLLEDEGFEVVGEALTGQDGVAAAAEIDTELVLVDVGLPDIDGFDVVERIAAGAHAPPVVLTSIRSAGDFANLIHDSSARGFLTKDEITGDALRAILRRRASRHREHLAHDGADAVGTLLRARSHRDGGEGATARVAGGRGRGRRRVRADRHRRGRRRGVAHRRARRRRRLRVPCERACALGARGGEPARRADDGPRRPVAGRSGARRGRLRLRRRLVAGFRPRLGRAGDVRARRRRVPERRRRPARRSPPRLGRLRRPARTDAAVDRSSGRRRATGPSWAAAVRALRVIGRRASHGGRARACRRARVAPVAALVLGHAARAVDARARAARGRRERRPAVRLRRPRRLLRGGWVARRAGQGSSHSRPLRS